MAALLENPSLPRPVDLPEEGGASVVLATEAGPCSWKSSNQAAKLDCVCISAVRSLTHSAIRRGAASPFTVRSSCATLSGLRHREYSNPNVHALTSVCVTFASVNNNDHNTHNNNNNHNNNHNHNHNHNHNNNNKKEKKEKKGEGCAIFNVTERR